MRAAGTASFDGRVEILELVEPRPLAGDGVLIEFKRAGIGKWEEFVRAGGWDVGLRPPMALGVQGAGTIFAVGEDVTEFATGR